MNLTEQDLKTKTMGNLLDSLLTDLWALNNYLNTQLLTPPGLDVGTTSTKFKVGAINYRLDGKLYSKAAADDVATPNGNTGSGQYRKDLISIDSSGNYSVLAGSVASSQASAALPSDPTRCPVGYIEVPQSFTAGTTAVTAGMLKSIDMTQVHTIGTGFTK